MKGLNWADVNSLDAIAGTLRHCGMNGESATLLSIKAKIIELLEKENEDERT